MALARFADTKSLSIRSGHKFGLGKRVPPSGVGFLLFARVFGNYRNWFFGFPQHSCQLTQPAESPKPLQQLKLLPLVVMEDLPMTEITKLFRTLVLFVICFNATTTFSCGQSVESELYNAYRITPRTGLQHIDLDGEWNVSYMDQPVVNTEDLRTKDSFTSKVPNSIHWSLFNAGKLPHPYHHMNSTQYRWLEEKVWYYTKSFVLPASAKGNLVFICFDGIDYFSKVWVNSKVAGVHQGMFGGPSIEATSLLKYGESNEITVEVRAANWGNRATDFEKLPRNASGERDYTGRKGFNPMATGSIIRPWVISGGSGTEAFFSVGMWQGARVEIVPAYHLERPYLTTKSISPGEAVLHLSTEIFTSGKSTDYRIHPWNNTQIHHPGEKGLPYVPLNEKLTLSIKLTHKGKTAMTKRVPLGLYRGRNWVEEDIKISDPKLWQPNGLGSPELYEVSLVLEVDEKEIDKIMFTYGIRTIERLFTAGPRTFDRWERWQFVVNGKKIFVKGMNWTPADVLLDLSEERYRWALTAAKEMGVQMLRVWGGGLIETDTFYKICNELGIMVWQDFPIGNQDTPDFPQQIWEEQVVQNIFRLRNHPSLVVWCGGNEFNPYSTGNAASIGIVERNLDIFDPTRFFVRTTPDDGSIHIYPDMDPTWYNKSYKNEAWISETGIHTIPEPSLFHEVVDKSELFELNKMWDVKFAEKHPEFIHHFTEYGPGRVPRMLSRASHIDDMKNTTLESISEASQIGAAEWYQIVSEKMQGNYPVTAGLMPWVFKRHWPVIAIQMMDWFGQPTAPYYFLKRTYEPVHVSMDIPRLLWRAGETMPIKTIVTNSKSALDNAKVTVSVFDVQFRLLAKQEQRVDIAEGASVARTDFDSFTIPKTMKDQFIFFHVVLRDSLGNQISSSFYFPRVLSMMDSQEFYNNYVQEPVPWVTLENGPWLKPLASKTKTRLSVQVIDIHHGQPAMSAVKLRIRNIGNTPSFMTQINIEGTKRVFYASDNYFWLSPGEEKEVNVNVHWRESITRRKAEFTVRGWNTSVSRVPLK